MSAPVTVIIPTFNRADVLPGAIRSALGQTLSPSEILVVDDGSTDDIEAVVRAFPRVGYLRQENQGVAAARNFGVEEAREKYVAFLDSDDRWVSSKLASQMALIEASGADILGSRKRYIPAGVEPELDGPSPSTAHHLITFARQTRRTWFAPSTMIFLRDTYLRLGGFSSDFPIASDWAFWLEIAWMSPIPRLDAVHALCFRSAVRMTDNRLAKYRSDLRIVRHWDPRSNPRLSPAFYRRWARRFALHRTFKLAQRDGVDAARAFWAEASEVLPLDRVSRATIPLFLRVP